jgi:signal transduction histidine kinase
LPGLDPEDIAFGAERYTAALENSLKEQGFLRASQPQGSPGFIAINYDDGSSVAIGVIKYLGNAVGFIAIHGDESQTDTISLAEAAWLCVSQLTLRVHAILSPNSPMAVEVLGRRIIRSLSGQGVRALTIGPAVGNAPWISLHRLSGRTEVREIERLPQDQVAAIGNGEVIGENTLKFLWGEFDVALGIWITSDAGYHLAVGFEDRKLPSPQIVGKIKAQVETAARNDYDYLIKSFDKLKIEFDRMIKSERAAAVTETTVTINHEINNPLTAILGNTQLLLMSRDKLPADIVTKLETVERSAVKIRETTAKLMSIIEPVTTPYVSGLEMIDIEKSRKKDTPRN